MPFIRSILLAIIVSVMIFAGSGIVTAQTQATGSMDQSDSMAWTISSGAIDGTLAPGEVQATTNYGENTQAQGGKISYTKVFSVDTRNMGIGQYNVNSQRILSFDGLSSGTGNGRAVSNEEIGLETAGTSPAFHGQVSAGSSFDLARGALSSNARTRNVAATPDIPAELNYDVGLQGLSTGNGTTVPAVGTASAFMNINNEQARENSAGKSSDLQYSHRSGVSGLINRFNQNMHYQSGTGTLI